MSVTSRRMLNLDTFCSKGFQNLSAFPDTSKASFWVKEVREYKYWASSSSLLFSSFFNDERGIQLCLSASSLVPILNYFFELSRNILESFIMNFLYLIRTYVQIRHLSCNRSGSDELILWELTWGSQIIFHSSWSWGEKGLFLSKMGGTLIKSLGETVDWTLSNFLKLFKSFSIFLTPIPTPHIGEDIRFVPLMSRFMMLLSNKILDPVVPPTIKFP